ncbi:MAG: SirA family protein [Kordiimonas sp.]|nr:SirA family protein [Kordiimonas sp.]
MTSKADTSQRRTLRPGSCEPSPAETLVLDVTGLACPIPVLRCRRQLEGLAIGDVLTVVATDPMAQLDLTHFCHQAGHMILEQYQEDETLYFKIRKGQPVAGHQGD